MSIAESTTSLETLQEGLAVHFGWEDHLAKQLVQKSQQAHITSMVPSDSGEKFRNIQKVEAWLEDRFPKSDPIIAWFGAAANELAGIAWIENAHVKANRGSRIFGVRVYEGYEDRGIGRELTSLVHEMFDQSRPNSKTQFTMVARNNKAFSVGARAGYRLQPSSNSTQLFVRNQQ